MNENCIIIFIKYPEPGKVKSRLTNSLDEKIVVELYKLFVSELISLLKTMGYPFKIAYYPIEAEKSIKNWLGANYSYFPQRGYDLGEKMKNAFYDTFADKFKNVIIIGSDSPDLTINIFREAFYFLQKSDSVIGPALDGGYYLIAFNKEKFLPDIFNNIEWSTNTVFQNTMKTFQEHCYNVHKLTEWRDIDTYEDLEDLVKRNKNNDFSKSKTVSFLIRNKIIK